MAESKNFSIFRLAPLATKSTGKGSLGQSLRHIDRHEQSADISRPELSHLNHDFCKDTPTYKECVKIGVEFREKHNKAVDEWNSNHDKPKKRHLKKDTVQFFEGVATFSPDMEKSLSVEEWAKETVRFIKKEYSDRGCEVLRCVIHRDEETAHIHFIFASYDKEKQNCTFRNIAGGREGLSKLQDRYAEQMKHFGLERGYSRYKQYKTIARRAAKAFGVETATHEQIEQFAKENNLALPRHRGHKSLGVYKAELEQYLNEITKQIEQSKKDLIALEKEKNAIQYDIDHLADRVFEEDYKNPYRDNEPER